MSIHENSARAYDELVASGHTQTWRWRVWCLYKAYGKTPLTDRDVQVIFGQPDSKSTQPSISTLVKMGSVIEVGHTVCEHSGKRVRLCIAGPWYDKRPGGKRPPPLFSLQQRMPPVPGYYWYAANKSETPRIVRVTVVTDDEVWFIDEDKQLTTAEGWWSIPLMPPCFYP